MTEQTMNSTTFGGTLIFCDYLTAKGYANPSQVDPWKTAIKKVGVLVDGEEYEARDWVDIDPDEYLERFQRLAGTAYKTESVVAYGRRIRNALDAHKQFLETGRAPVPKTTARRQKAETQPAAETGNGSVTSIDGKKQQQVPVASPDMVTFPYPLDDGRMISITIPPRLKSGDVDRICAFIRTLQDNAPERRQLMRGENQAA